MKKDRSIVYVVKAGAYVKVGYTRATVEKRVSEYESGIPVPWAIIHQQPLTSTAGLVVEAIVHEWLKSKRSYGEWFKVSPELAVTCVKDAVRVVRMRDRIKRNAEKAHA